MVEVNTSSSVPSITLSFALFLLYAISQVFDLDHNMRQTIIDPHVSKLTIVYTYVSGYFLFILKILMSICIVFVSFIVIFVLLTAIMYMFSAEKNIVSIIGAKNVGSAIEKVTTSLKDSMVSIVSTISKCTLGIFLVPKMILVQFIVIPLTMVVTCLIYLNLTYGNEDQTNDEADKIAKTNYFFLLYYLITIFLSSMLFVYITYVITIFIPIVATSNKE